jgi:hypothetical protein
MAGQERCTPPREHIDRTAPRSALWLPIRETATLDRLSSGRLTLGVGLGSDRFGSELSKTGEQLDDRLRGQMLDEALEILTAAWSGEPVHHRGQHYTVEGIQFLPRPVQQPGCRCGSRDSPATSPPAHDGAVRLRRRSPAWDRPGALRQGGRHLVLVEFPWDKVSVDEVRGVLRDGPGGNLSHE